MIWSEQEELFLLENWKIKKLEEITSYLNRTENSIIRKAVRLGLNTNKEKNELLKRKWSSDDDNFLITNYNSLPLYQIIEYLNRSKESILKRAQFLGISQKLNRWSTDEINYLEENWGIRSVKYIASKLNRTPDAILLKARQLSLREQALANGHFLTPKCISDILNINIRRVYEYILDNKLIYRKLKIGKKFKYQITTESFLHFLRYNPEDWNSKLSNINHIKSYYSSHYINKNNKFSINNQVPDWLQEKIEADKASICSKPSKIKWTKHEDNLLICLSKNGYTLEEISKKLNRTYFSVKTRYYTIRKIYTKKQS